MTPKADFDDDDAVVAIEFASNCGLKDVLVISRTELAESGIEFVVRGDSLCSSEGLSQEDAKAQSDFLANGLALRLIVTNDKVVSHEWVGVQMS